MVGAAGAGGGGGAGAAAYRFWSIPAPNPPNGSDSARPTEALSAHRAGQGERSHVAVIVAAEGGPARVHPLPPSAQPAVALVQDEDGGEEDSHHDRQNQNFQHLAAAAQACQNEIFKSFPRTERYRPDPGKTGISPVRAQRARNRGTSRDEVLGRRVRAGVGGLFGLQLGVLAHGHADALRAQELHNFRVVGQIGARRVCASSGRPDTAGTARSSSAPSSSAKPSSSLPSAVPVLGQGLGHLHPETMEEQVILVLVGGLRDLAPIVTSWRPPYLRLSRRRSRRYLAEREGEPHDLVVPALVLVDDQVASPSELAGKSAARPGGSQVGLLGLGRDCSRSTTETRSLNSGSDSWLALSAGVSPTRSEQRRQVQVVGDLVERDLGHPAAEERRGEDPVVGGHLGRATGAFSGRGLTVRPERAGALRSEISRPEVGGL